MIPRFCIQMNIRDKEATPCSVQQLKTIMTSVQVQQVCDQIKLLDGKDKEELQTLKKQLPVITPHAQRFTNNSRSNQNAVPSGLVMLDIDDVTDPHSLANRLDSEQMHSHRVYFVAITPSGHGLRIIAERQEGEPIAQAQQRLADLYGVSSYDSATKDLARASYVMPWSYVIYMDGNGLEFDSQAQADQVAQSYMVQPQPCVVQPQPCAAPCQSSTDKEQPSIYKGVPYGEIINQLVNLLGGEPEVGERNTFYFTLVRYARYICDFNRDTLLRVLPSFDLSEQERTSIILSAINRPRKSDLPDIICRALTLAQLSSTPEAARTGTSSLPPLPKLPRVLDIICHRLPEPYRPAMVIASLPVLGTLATRVRFDYLDHQQHSFSFMSCITAPCATGKSFIRRPINLLLTPIDEQDEVEREKEQGYKEALRAAKNSKQQPENPRACPRNNGINISIAKLLQLLSYSEGKHLIGIGEEIDTLVKSERAGVWSQKSDIYRLGFDNAKYGQNYMSDNSFSANVPVYYNLLLTGTPGGMYRFFKDVEDGLVTRFAFAQLPDMFGTDIPDFQSYTAAEEQDIIRIARMLDMAQGTIYAPFVNQRISAWLTAKKELAIQNDSRAMDTIRKRAAVMGFRAGYLAALLNGTAKRNDKHKDNISDITKKKQQEVADFAEWVAEYIFDNQMALFGEQFEQVATKQLLAQEHRGCVRNLLQSLPDVFSRVDLMAIRAKNGQSTEVRYVLSRWMDAGFITKVDATSYRKNFQRIV